MAQNITLQGASYSDVPSVLLPKTGGGTASFTDVTSTTATASDVASGKLFFDALGVLTTGTASGGGGTGVTLVCSKQITTSTTNTSAETVETWGTSHSEIWTGDKILYVKVRDNAGPRSGYFFGTDNFFVNVSAKTAGSTSSTVSTRLILRVNSTGTSYTTSGYSTTTGYGLYVDTVNSNGGLRVRKRYHSTYSSTVNGTYTLSVYLIDVGTLLPSL